MAEAISPHRHHNTARPEKAFRRITGNTIITRMDSSKTEISNTGRDSTPKKKKRLRKLAYWLFIDVSVAVLVIALLLHRPGNYRPTDPGEYRQGEIHPYLTQISADFYNGAQTRKAFTVEVEQAGINEAIARADWPRESQGVLLYAPAILFEPGRAVLMATADIEGVKLIVTVEIEPKVDEKGLLNLEVAKVKVGAMNITPLAKMTAKKMYNENIQAGPVNTETLPARIVASLLTSQAFDPVFKAEDAKARLTKVEVVQGKLVMHLEPLGE